MRKNKQRLFLGVAVMVGLGLALGGCESVRNAAGLNKQPPDEFAVVTKAPLIIPPDYNLKPPKPGAAPTNQSSPTVAAESAMFSDDPNTVAQSVTGNFSDGEKLLLAYAHAINVDHTIRQQIASDNRTLQSASESFTNQLLFNTPDDGDSPVDADAEKKRIDDAKASGGSPAPASDPQKSSDSKKDGGSWLDGIF